MTAAKMAGRYAHAKQFKQHYLPHLRQHLLVRPAPFADEMQQRLMLRRRPLRCRYRRYRLNALAFAGHHQPQAIVA